jgi:hypothetical protein
MRISLKRLALRHAAILLVAFGLQQAALGQDEIPLVFPDPAPVLPIEPPNVPLVPMPPAPSVTPPAESAAEATEQGASSEAAGETTPSEESAEPAQSEPEAEAQTALAAEGGPAQYQIPVLPSKQFYGASNGSFTYSVDLDLPPFHGIEPNLSLRYSSNVGLRAGGKSQGWLGVGWILDGLDFIERASARQGTPRFDDAPEGKPDIFLWNGEPLAPCTGEGTPSATCAAPTADTDDYLSRVESYRRFRYFETSNTWRITRQDGVLFILWPVSYFMPGSSDPLKLRTEYRWLLAKIIDTHGNTVSLNYDCDVAPQCELETITYTGTRVRFYWEDRTDVVSYGNGLPNDPDKGLSKATKRLKTIAVHHGLQPSAEALQKAFALTYEQNPVSKLSRIKEIIPYGSDAVIDDEGDIGGTPPPVPLPRHSFEYSEAGTELALGPVVSEDGEDAENPAVADVDADGKDDLIFDGRKPDTPPGQIQGRFLELNEGEDAFNETPIATFNRPGGWYAPYDVLFGHFPSAPNETDKYLDFLYIFKRQEGTDPVRYLTTFMLAMSNGNGAWTLQAIGPDHPLPAFIHGRSELGFLAYRVEDRDGDGIDEVYGSAPAAFGSSRIYGYDFDGDGIGDTITSDDDGTLTYSSGASADVSFLFDGGQLSPTPR